MTIPCMSMSKERLILEIVMSVTFATPLTVQSFALVEETIPIAIMSTQKEEGTGGRLKYE